MLHKVKRPDCAAQMSAILRLQYKVLALACRLKKPDVLDDPAIFERKLGRAGRWLFERVRDKADFRQAMIGLIEHVEGNAVRRQEILRAFLNDSRFHQRWLDDNFRFTFRHLEPETQKRVGALMELFYDYLLDLGFPAEMFNQQAKFSRKEFSAAFWAANDEMRLCPACDGPRPPLMHGKVASQNDHYFPNSRYPFLAVHASNLLPVCVYCNFLKQAQDPIDYNLDESLRSSFLPYESPAAEHLHVMMHRSPEGQCQVELQATEPLQQMRLKNLCRLLRLDERWAGELQTIIGRLLEDLRSALWQNQRIDEVEVTAIEEWMSAELRKRESQIGRYDGSLATVGYLRFAISDADELDHLRRAVIAP